MAVSRRSPRQQPRTKKKTKTSSRSVMNSDQREILLRYFPVWMILLAIAIIVLPIWISTIVHGVWKGLQQAPGVVFDAGSYVIEQGVDLVGDAAETVGGWVGGDDSGKIAVFFTDEIHYWEDEIIAWAEPHDLDPNLLATIMQIESCGHPTIGSSAGARGLFQVMPFHFASDEDTTDPDTNAMRGANVIAQCLEMTNGDTGLALACYNGGPSVLGRSINRWPLETQRYYYWGTGIYESAVLGNAESPRLDQWLTNGHILCDLAAAELK